MKLLKKTGLYFLGFSVLLLTIGGLFFYYSLITMLDHEMDENLYHTKDVLVKELNAKDSLPAIIEIMDEVIDVKEVPTFSDLEVYKDTLIEVLEEGELEAEIFRQYIFTEKIKGRYYRISLNHSKFEREHLLSIIAILIIGGLLFFLLSLNLFNRFISKKLWQPFYHTIDQIRSYSLTQSNKITSIPTDIKEFQNLHEVLEKMTGKLSTDYRSLKQFTENASHEIQTPLAIIQSQVELILQDERNEDIVTHLQKIQQSTSKLSKLNRSLLLLTRIENRQFNGKEKINLPEIISQKLEALEVLIQDNKLQVQKNMVPVVVTANPVLVDIIISNLLTNAIKHNHPNGTIICQLTTNRLMIKNTGTILLKKPIDLFERFQKSDDASQSVGLGLAIVKEICEVYNWKIDYQNNGEWHNINIDFYQN